MTQPCSSQKVVFFILNAAAISTNPVCTDFTKLKVNQMSGIKTVFGAKKMYLGEKRNVRNME